MKTRQIDHGCSRAEEPNGREASSPKQIPSAAERIFSGALQRLNSDRVILVATCATYYALLALVPALTALHEMSEEARFG
jgi:hypothetical protein